MAEISSLNSTSAAVNITRINKALSYPITGAGDWPDGMLSHVAGELDEKTDRRRSWTSKPPGKVHERTTDPASAQPMFPNPCASSGQSRGEVHSHAH